MSIHTHFMINGNNSTGKAKMIKKKKTLSHKWWHWWFKQPGKDREKLWSYMGNWNLKNLSDLQKAAELYSFVSSSKTFPLTVFYPTYRVDAHSRIFSDFQVKLKMIHGLKRTWKNKQRLTAAQDK